MPELDYSIVLTAPLGFDACPYLEDWERMLDGYSAEIIVADGLEGDADKSRGRVRHIRMPNVSFLGLMTEGARQARGTWVLLSEDHCRPLTHLLAAYSLERERNPAADLIAGRVDNLTSRSPWSFAIFSIGLSEVWHESTRLPSKASNANLLIRRSAFRPEELATPGGLLLQAVPRLAATGRMAVCRDALVDHIVRLERGTAIRFEAECTGRCWAESRALAGPRGWWADAVDALKRCVGCAFIVPWRVARNVRGTSQARLAPFARITFVCLAVALRLGFADLKRLIGRMRATRTA